MAKIQKKIETTIPFNSIFLFSTQRLSIREPPNYLPTEATEPTEVSGARYSPTDCTDIHRLGGYGIPAIPTPPSEFLPQNHSKFVCASPPTEFTEFTEVSGGGYSPTDFTEYTEASGVEEPPTDFTDVHRFFFSASRFCVFREFCGKIVLWLRGYGRDAIPS